MLHRIGCTVRKVTDRDIVLMTFTEDETEIMAEMEHTLWNVERLRDGPLVYTMVHELYFKGGMKRLCQSITSLFRAKLTASLNED